jgi:hypothetical protein
MPTRSNPTPKIQEKSKRVQARGEDRDHHLTEREIANILTLLTERETARILAVSRAALRYWRKHGGGPPWARIGEWHVRYELFALRAWIEQRSMNGGRNGH